MKVLVLGMHRSGTSAVAGALSAAGFYLGSNEELVGGLPENPRGFFERSDVVSFDDRLLSALGWTWDAPDPTPLAEPPALNRLVAEGRRLVRSAVGSSKHWAIKDPRISLLLPWWRRVLGDRFVSVVCLRPPMEVAWSLAVRDGFRPELGVALWSAYYRHLTEGLSGMPVIGVDFAALTDNPRGVVPELLHFLARLGTTGPLDSQAAADSIAPQLRRAALVGAGSRDGELNLAARALLDLWSQAAPVWLTEHLDLVAPPASPREAEILEEHRQRPEAQIVARRRLRTDHYALRAAGAALGAEIDAARAHNEDLLAKSDSLRTEADLLRADRESVSAKADLLRADNESLRADRESLSAKADLLRADNESLRADGHALRAQADLVGADNENLRGDGQVLRAQVESLRADNENLRGDADRRTAKGAQLEADNARLRTALDARANNLPHRLLSTARGPARSIRRLFLRVLVKLVPSTLLGHVWHNPLFDSQWYAMKYGLAGKRSDPEREFRSLGVHEGRNPNALFDTVWYLADNPDVAAVRMNPLDHYLLFGGREGRDPSRAFDSDWYLATNPDVEAVGLNPLLHYLRYGAHEGRLPHPEATETRDNYAR